MKERQTCPEGPSKASSFWGDNEMPTLPGLLPFCLDFLPVLARSLFPPLQGPASVCLLGSVSHVAHVSVSICPSEPAFHS